MLKRRLTNYKKTKFIKTCKRENLIPTFANVKLAIKTGNAKLKKKIAHLILETEV